MVEQLNQNDQAQAASVVGLVFEDQEHNTHTLQSLNKMRKNRHFCDVILHVRTAVGCCAELLRRFRDLCVVIVGCNVAWLLLLAAGVMFNTFDTFDMYQTTVRYVLCVSGS
jgi:hypothetical protein